MNQAHRLLVENWSVDYGEGPEPCVVPHSWNQDVSVEFEGPVLYSTTLEVPRQPLVLRFYGVSYQARVFINGDRVLVHRGIWDSFDVDLGPYGGSRIEVRVEVIKNGGDSFPVRDVASGFLPYVFQTFGGIYREVEMLPKEQASYPAAVSRVKVNGGRISVDGRPSYIRGILHWGWYPELGHPNPTEEVIRTEVRAIKARGFNLVKFCLWVPPHRYLKILREEEMEAWLELPLWQPSGEAHALTGIADELEQIVRQYRQHENIICWTVGCELNSDTTADFRRTLLQIVRNLSGCPLVKDNSGGAEMYGGDLREFGTVDDFHPYCDLPFYPGVLDSLLPGPRPKRPMLLGEFNDSDVHRDLARIGDEMPFWASSMRELNAKGVRWQYDLPSLVTQNRFATEPRKNRHRSLMESSREKSLFIRKTVQELVRSHEAISGYVITGLRDTPISSSGFLDDWGAPRFSAEECESWNGSTALFRIPSRRPPWINGGNRAGYVDLSNFFAGQVFFRIGVHTTVGERAGLLWTLRNEMGEVVVRGGEDEVSVPPLVSIELAQVSIDLKPGTYELFCEFGENKNRWRINVFEPWTENDLSGWGVSDSARLLESLKLEGDQAWLRTSPAPEAEGPGIVLLTDEGTLPSPFWRESAYEFSDGAFGLADRWERLLPISGDRVIDPSQLSGPFETIINRIDARTYEEYPVLVKTGDTYVTTLRPQGGLGDQPYGVLRNPSGAELLRDLARSLH